MDPKITSQSSTMTTEAEEKNTQQATSNEQEELTAGKNVKIAYGVNVLLPGIGNIYFGQTILGIVVFLIFLLSIFLFFAGGYAGMIGIGVIIASVIVAIPTAGLALIVGLPVGLMLLFMGAGAFVSIGIWVLCIALSLFFIYRKEKGER